MAGGADANKTSCGRTLDEAWKNAFEEIKTDIADVVIYAPYRGKGYGRKALRLLCEIAKENGIKELYDDIAIDNSSVELFLKCGFEEVLRSNEYILVKKELWN